MTIKELLQKYGMTQKGLSKQLGIPLKNISNWCSDSPTAHRECPEWQVRLFDACLAAGITIE